MERVACLLPAGVPLQVEAWSVAVTADHETAKLAQTQQGYWWRIRSSLAL